MPRVNVTVTEEQHRLLLELAQLQGGSAAGYLRQQLDVSTPLLRAAVPLLRRAAQESEVSRREALDLLQEPLRVLSEMGVQPQDDLLDSLARPARRSRPPAASGSERGRTRATA